MKKTLTLLSTLTFSIALFSQVQETIVVNEDFSSNLFNKGIMFYNYGYSSRQNQPGVGGVAGLWQLYLENDMQQGPMSRSLSWNGDLNTNADSTKTELKLLKKNNAINISEKTVYFYTYQPFNFNYKGAFFSGHVHSNYSASFSKVTETTEYVLVENHYIGTMGSDKPVFMSLEKDISMFIIQGVNSGYSERDGFSLSDAFCNGEFPGDNNCFYVIQSVLLSPTYLNTLQIDDLKIKQYTTVTGLENEKTNHNKEVIAVYNLLGLKSSLDVKNETLFVTYSDGSSERIFNVR